MKTKRPIFYPTEIEDDASVVLNSAKAHLALVRKKYIKVNK